jgi:hypothetical protein
LLDQVISHLILGTLRIAEGVFSGWVNVTNVSANEGPISILLLPAGGTLFQQLASATTSTTKITADLLSLTLRIF